MDTPRLGPGVPLLLELLSPAGRPLQVTADLASFWRDQYSAVKKDMKGRYPKHYWCARQQRMRAPAK
jgi:ATP-dependent helicase HrpB